MTDDELALRFVEAREMVRRAVNGERAVAERWLALQGLESLFGNETALCSYETADETAHIVHDPGLGGRYLLTRIEFTCTTGEFDVIVGFRKIIDGWPCSRAPFMSPVKVERQLTVETANCKGGGRITLYGINY